MLARDEPRVRHELPRRREAGERAELRDERRRGHAPHAAQRGQRADERLLCGAQARDRLLDRLLEAPHARGDVLDLRAVLVVGGLQHRGVEPLLREPAQVPERPAAHPLRPLPAVAQEELADAVPGAELVLLGDLAGAHQVAQRLGGGVGDPHRREVAGAVAAGELRRVAPVGLQAVAGLRRHEARRDHGAGHAEPDELPVERVARRPRLVADLEAARRAELRHELADCLGAVGMVPSSRTLPSGSATAAVMVSAWTSRPTWRMLSRIATASVMLWLWTIRG